MGASVFYAAAAELATLANTFSVLGVPTDPTTVALDVTDPAGATTTYTYPATITRLSAGVYTHDVACPTAGVWRYTWTGTGTASDVTLGTWTVFDPVVTGHRYCTLEQLKSRLRIAGTDTVDDFELSLAIDTATSDIDEWCERRFWSAVETRTFIPDSFYRCDVDDLVSVTTLKTDADGDGVFETTWAVGDFQLWPPNPNARTTARPYTSILARGANLFPFVGGNPLARSDVVQILGPFGWPRIPVAVNQASLILSADFLASGSAPFGIQGFGDFAVRIRGNPRAESLLAKFRKHSMLVA